MDLTPGSKTSEFKLAAAVAVAGVGVDVLSLLLSTLTDAGLAMPWLAPVALVVGLLVQVSAVLGYTRSRTMLKAVRFQPLLAPIVREAITVAKELKAEKAAAEAVAVPAPEAPVAE